MKPKRVLGLDLGSRAFKLALVETQDSKAVLILARLAELPISSGKEGRLAALKSLLAGVDLSQVNEIVSVVDDPFACVRQVSVPPMPPSELADAVKWELQRFLAVPPEEVAVDFKAVGFEETGGIKKQKLLAAAFPSDALKEHLALLEQAGVKPSRLIPKTEALGAWLRRISAETPALLEVGGNGCEFLVLEKGEAVFSRKIAGGGAQLTKEMTGALMTGQGQVSLSEQEAETAKRSLGIPQGEAAALSVKGVSGMQVFSLIRGNLERLAAETERSLAFYTESGGHAGVEEIALAGGGAHLKGLAEWLQSRLGAKVLLPDPLKGLAQTPGALEAPAAASPLSLAAAVGAALSGGRGMNLLPQELQEGMRSGIRKAALKGAVTGILLGALILWGGLHLYRQSLSRQIAAFELEQQAVSRRLPAVRASQEMRDAWQREPEWREIFRQLTHQVPQEIYLTELAVDGQEIVLRGRVRKGRSADEPLARFMEALSEGGIKEPALRSSRQLEQSVDQAEFEIRGKLG